MKNRKWDNKWYNKSKPQYFTLLQDPINREWNVCGVHDEESDARSEMIYFEENGVTCLVVKDTGERR
jgi:hypothetical protein